MAEIKTILLEVGPLAVCCYLLFREGEESCCIIDPGGDTALIQERCSQEGVTPEVILLTHSHFDHVGGVTELHAAFPNARILCHPECSPLMQSPAKNLSAMIGAQVKTPPPNAELQDGETLTIGSITLTALHVPGHSPGHLVFYCEEGNLLFSGDTLFNGSLGRTDFPGSSYDLLAAKLTEKILSLPEITRVYPGHGAHTTIGREKRFNPFIRNIEAS
ncbi:MAG: MBL fold metallo-hydrolase [Planctomycetota bacterium]